MRRAPARPRREATTRARARAWCVVAERRSGSGRRQHPKSGSEGSGVSEKPRMGYPRQRIHERRGTAAVRGTSSGWNQREVTSCAATSAPAARRVTKWHGAWHAVQRSEASAASGRASFERLTSEHRRQSACAEQREANVLFARWCFYLSTGCEKLSLRAIGMPHDARTCL